MLRYLETAGHQRTASVARPLCSWHHHRRHRRLSPLRWTRRPCTQAQSCTTHGLDVPVRVTAAGVEVKAAMTPVDLLPPWRREVGHLPGRRTTTTCSPAPHQRWYWRHPVCPPCCSCCTPSGQRTSAQTITEVGESSNWSLLHEVTLRHDGLLPACLHA